MWGFIDSIEKSKMDDLNKIKACLHDRIHEFIENEAISCSMDFGMCFTSFNL